jgi:hypothetical protein
VPAASDWFDAPPRVFFSKYPTAVAGLH